MKLHGPDLSVRMQGDDVALLQNELRQLGVDIPVADTGYFNETTLRALL